LAAKVPATGHQTTAMALAPALGWDLANGFGAPLKGGAAKTMASVFCQTLRESSQAVVVYYEGPWQVKGL